MGHSLPRTAPGISGAPRVPRGLGIRIVDPNGPQRAPEVSRQLPELRNSGAKGNFGAQARRWDEANMGTKSHQERESQSVS
jgi:hypothetical protein